MGGRINPGAGALQGNLDPLALLAGGAALDAAVDDILEALRRPALIFNLGHGVLPRDADRAHVERLVDRVQAARLKTHDRRWIKALHIIAVIAWMAGMLYLPRLFVYHVERRQAPRCRETFKIMERRLLRFIINPAMIVAWLTGPWLAYEDGFFAAPWLHAKLGAGARHVRVARLFRACGEEIRGRRECPAGAVLSHPQRSPDGSDDWSL